MANVISGSLRSFYHRTLPTSMRLPLYHLRRYLMACASLAPASLRHKQLAILRRRLGIGTPNGAALATLSVHFHEALIRHTDNYGHLTWLGHPIWQNVLDLWVIQETLSDIRPTLLIESGTNRGGSSLFYGHLFDLMGHGRIVTIDVERLHDLSHPRVTYLIGDSVGESILTIVRAEVEATHGPVMVILDSDHSEIHVTRELEAYAPFVSPNSFLLVQDGVIDILTSVVGGAPGPLVAIDKFLQLHPEYEVDEERCNRFLITHHPRGWLRRRPRKGSAVIT